MPALKIALLGLAALLAPLGAARARPASPAAALAPLPRDAYRRPEAWLCRPGREGPCETGLDAVRVDAEGGRTPLPFTPAAAPAVDCFYVYPTASRQVSDYADMQADPELVATARAQAGRLSSECRLFAPVYRQLTGAGLKRALEVRQAPNWNTPYLDVRTAWRDYLRHDNKGRGVVLVGHSQGTILLQRLLAEEIDGKPAQARLVGAYLAGDPALAVPAGAAVGGSLKSIPLCRASGQTGCVTVWASYQAGAPSPARLFGHDPGAGLLAACVNPAAPAGGSAVLDAVLPRPASAPAGDPPYVEATGQLSARCERDDQGEVLRVSVLPGRYAALLQAMLDARTRAAPDWGLHGLDIGLVQGDLVSRIAAQSASWRARPR